MADFRSLLPASASQGLLPLVLRWAAWLRREIFFGIVLAPLEPMPHASRWRMGWIGILILCGNPLFGWLWLYKFPQVWENMEFRLVAASLGLLLLLMAFALDSMTRKAQLVLNVVVFLDLPVLFSWMYFCNDGNKVWLASAVAMVIIYYQMVDWRIAALGVPAGALIAWIIFQNADFHTWALAETETQINNAVLGFAWAVATVLGFSAANQRRLRLRSTLTTIGIVAHELRTPLATVALIAQTLRAIASSAQQQVAGSIEPLAERLETLTRTMNHQIDMQVTNARQLNLSSLRERIEASLLVQDAIAQFPFRNPQERDAVVVRIRKNFCFNSSRALFDQVLANLLTNALRALAATDRPLRAGDIVIEIDATAEKGRLTVADHGIGIAPALKERIFEPFFSGHSHTGNGLGLAFCKRVIKNSGGSIQVQSQHGHGATFIIEMPLAQP